MSKKFKTALIALFTIGIIGVVALPSASAFQPVSATPTKKAPAAVVQPSPNTVGDLEIKTQGIGSGDYGLLSLYGSAIRNNTISEDKLGSQFRNKVAAAAAQAQAAENKADDALERPDSGATADTVTFDPTLIKYIGGPYFDPARGFTTIGTFTLPAGTWNLDTTVTFSRTVAGDAGVRPQVGLRVGQGTASPDWGTELGTVGGNDISKVKNKQLWGSTQGSITVTSPTVVGVYGHGFTDTEGTEGSNEIAATVKIKVSRG